ncbi:MAG: hypothetical protein RIR04_2408, partial [Pseudomonadota bacterium]
MAGKRKIFEEVGLADVAQAATGGMIALAPKGARGAVRVWLMMIFAL